MNKQTNKNTTNLRQQHTHIFVLSRRVIFRRPGSNASAHADMTSSSLSVALDITWRNLEYGRGRFLRVIRLALLARRSLGCSCFAFRGLAPEGPPEVDCLLQAPSQQHPRLLLGLLHGGAADRRHQAGAPGSRRPVRTLRIRQTKHVSGVFPMDLGIPSP